MMMLKKLLTYSIALVGLFSLTAISCEDTENLLDIDVPQTFVETFSITTSEAEEISITETINPNEEDMEEYQDRIKDFSAESLSVEVTDNGSNGNMGSGELSVIINGATISVKTVEDINELENVTLESVDGLKDQIETALLNFESFDVKLDLSSDGAIDYTVTITIEGLITASPASNN